VLSEPAKHHFLVASRSRRRHLLLDSRQHDGQYSDNLGARRRPECPEAEAKIEDGVPNLQVRLSLPKGDGQGCARMLTRPMTPYRIRRVKCDESKPACQRCICTGRVCDGYGIWGGGGNRYGTAERAVNALLRANPQALERSGPATIPGLSQQEYLTFDFFRRRTATKLPGIFANPFWDSIVFQLSLREPAVLHAAIALAATHRHAITLGYAQRPSAAGCSGGMSPNERLALQQFNKAVGHLRHPGIKDRQSLRTVLVSCILFTCTELLKGEIGASQAHFQSGLNLLLDMQTSSVLQPQHDSIDDHLAEAFNRLNIQAAVVGQGPDQFHMTSFNTSTSRSMGQMPLVFDSLNTARKHLDYLMQKIQTLSTEVKLRAPCRAGTRDRLYMEQQRLQDLVAAWLRTFTSSLPRMESSGDRSDRLLLGTPLIYLYYHMAHVMAATCLQDGDEMEFDRHTSSFRAILEQAIELWNKVARLVPMSSRPGPSDHISFTVDMGFIPPLYFTALKCRVPRFRRLAMNLLSSAPHREGVWDGAVAAAIGRKIMQMEESDFYHTAGIDFPPSAPFPIADILTELPPNDVPLIPQLSRVQLTNVMLPEPGRGGMVTLVCTRYCQQEKSGKEGRSSTIVKLDVTPDFSEGREMHHLSCEW
jgi:hypothetical protein